MARTTVHGLNWLLRPAPTKQNDAQIIHIQMEVQATSDAHIALFEETTG